MADHTRAIEQIIPGIETTRFLSGDINYMENVIFSFIESVKTEKKRILKDVLKLASDYGIDQIKVCKCLSLYIIVEVENGRVELTRNIFCAKFLILYKVSVKYDYKSCIILIIMELYNKMI